MSVDRFIKSSFLYGQNAKFVEEKYTEYLNNPTSVASEWRSFFEGLEEDKKSALQALSVPEWGEKEVLSQPAAESVAKPVTQESDPQNVSDFSFNAWAMVCAYREKGHFLSNLDPLGIEQLPTDKEIGLNIENFSLTQKDLRCSVVLKEEFRGQKEWSLEKLQSSLKQIYSGKLGYEFACIESVDQKNWLASRIENFVTKQEFSSEERLEALDTLIKVEGFEHFLQLRFPGAKRFSVEGADNTITCSRNLIKLAALSGVENVIIGMPHRGRLNMLAKVFNKPYEAILAEFQGQYSHPESLDVSGDVKYHLGHSTDVDFDGNKVHISLTPNPSHLEAVNPVVAGRVRAKQDINKDKLREKSVGILFHGDAAFSGQGVVFESLMLEGLDSYDVGGIVHIVVNNQIGFTATPSKGRKTRYCTEVAKVIKAPVIHVNADNADDVIKAAKIAYEYKNKYKKDIVIDLVCYRLHGHNEMDEPRFTQPEMYQAIAKAKSPCALYAEGLVSEGLISSEEVDKKKQEFKDRLDRYLEVAKKYKPEKADWFEGDWKNYKRVETEKTIKTGCSEKMLKELGTKLTAVPEGFTAHKTILRGYASRAEAVKTGERIDWGCAEMLAFGSLLSEGHKVRLTGQDSRRGTFSHRQSVVVDQKTFQEYTPLNNISDSQGAYEVDDSPLSEYAALGFEYGYSVTYPGALTIWEAQFGDFANTAQVVVDQFISSAETKWLRASGLVMLLPHGYEGQGPEHSSARLERYLQLCAEDNMKVMNLTTPANYFHALREQMVSKVKKPLIIMTPKSLLRNKMAVSKLSEISEKSGFLPVIDDGSATKKEKKLVICSGKIYYDLLEEKLNEKHASTAVVRVERLYPFPSIKIEKIINSYKNLVKIAWCQEESKNMGSWNLIKDKIRKIIQKTKYKEKITLEYIGRPVSASPATGYAKMHAEQQDKIKKQVFN